MKLYSSDALRAPSARFLPTLARQLLLLLLLLPLLLLLLLLVRLLLLLPMR